MLIAAVCPASSLPGQQGGQRGGGGRGNFRVEETVAAGMSPNRGDFTLEEAIRARHGGGGGYRALTSPSRDEVSSANHLHTCASHQKAQSDLVVLYHCLYGES